MLSPCLIYHMKLREQFYLCVNMFHDLNIDITKLPDPSRVLNEIIDQLLEYNYRVIALTKEIDDSVFSCSKHKSKTSSSNTDPIPPSRDISSLKEKYPKATFYKRINIVINDSQNIRKVFQSKNIKSYDLISFQPENQIVMRSLTNVPGIDIISFNPESRCPYFLNRRTYNQFINQNVYFEYKYSSALTSPTARKNLIALSHNYHAIGKSKNVIITSGAFSSHQLRSPYDIMNFTLLFGLSEEQAKKAISRNCEKLLLKGRKQRHNKSMIKIVSLQNEKDQGESECVDLSEESSPIEVVEV